MARGIEDFNGLHTSDDYPAHYLSFTNGGRPPEEILETVHEILKDVHEDQRGIVDAAIVREVGGCIVRAIVDHSPTNEELDQLRVQGIRSEETIAA